MTTTSTFIGATDYESSMLNPRCVDTTQLAKRLSKNVRTWQITIVEATGSSNTDLLLHLRKNGSTLMPPIVRLAYTQTAGRGQRGRTWLGMRGDSLMFSLAYHMPRSSAQLAGLSLATGVAVVHALSDLPLTYPQALGLKWPNDVLLSGRKLGGILIETVPSAATHISVVIGIGINLRRADEVVTEQIIDLARAEKTMTSATAIPAALEEILIEPDMTIVLAAVLNRLETMLTRFAINGFLPFQKDWENMHVFANAPIFLIERGQNLLQGIALGIDSQGRLRISTQEGHRIVVSGDVSVRSVEPKHVYGDKK
ncbi:biotin--[acetyl-CoA-carboxylase] ligase [Candidatus Pandoraea novymonadis]|nr:biotin--[acetyl-CoA-carboxylase] ligase [Candidatus Pandoraea novymonadis]